MGRPHDRSRVYPRSNYLRKSAIADLRCRDARLRRRPQHEADWGCAQSRRAQKSQLAGPASRARDARRCSTAANCSLPSPPPARAPPAPRLASAQNAPLLTRKIPASGEQLPLVGLGSWRTFNVGDDPEGRAACAAVMAAFFAGGGRLIDSSPMYGSSQDTIGYGLAEARCARQGLCRRQGLDLFRRRRASRNLAREMGHRPLRSAAGS